jgi:hypothetical protein
MQGTFPTCHAGNTAEVNSPNDASADPTAARVAAMAASILACNRVSVITSARIWDLVTSRGSTEGVRDSVRGSDTVPTFAEIVAFSSLAAALMDDPKAPRSAQEHRRKEIPVSKVSSSYSGLCFL